MTAPTGHGWVRVVPVGADETEPAYGDGPAARGLAAVLPPDDGFDQHVSQMLDVAHAPARPEPTAEIHEEPVTVRPRRPSRARATPTGSARTATRIQPPPEPLDAPELVAETTEPATPAPIVRPRVRPSPGRSARRRGRVAAVVVVLLAAAGGLGALLWATGAATVWTIVALPAATAVMIGLYAAVTAALPDPEA